VPTRVGGDDILGRNAGRPNILAELARASTQEIDRAVNAATTKDRPPIFAKRRGRSIGIPKADTEADLLRSAAAEGGGTRGAAEATFLATNNLGGLERGPRSEEHTSELQSLRH